MRFLDQKFRDTCELPYGCETTDVNEGHFIVRFFDRQDYQHILENDPWMVLGYYLMVSKWWPNFRPEKESVNTTMVLIWFLGLPLEFYNADMLMILENYLVVAIWVDLTTLADV